MAKDFSDRYKKGKWRGMKAISVALPLALVLFLVFRFVLGISVVNGDSMDNTLKSGDLVIYSRLQRDVQPGDVVAYSMPSGDFYIKRVVAVAGDTVDIRDGKLYVNGVEENESHVLGKTLPESKMFTYPITVPDGHFFALGDNREDSADSRGHGSINLQQVIGVVQLRLGFFYINGL